MPSPDTLTFRPRARMLQLLGDQLIRSPRLAVFELVKNSYDADATHVSVFLDGLRTDHPTIMVEDNGVGMSSEIIRDVWFVPGHEHRREQKAANLRTDLGRLPMGDKGVGRFAVHRLGNIVEVTTRAQGQNEIYVRLDWPAILKEKFLEDARVKIVERKPEVFTGNRTGTKIVISDLRDVNWSRGDLRRLYRDITSICSPFERPDEFEIEFQVPGRENEIAGIPDASLMMDRAIWKFNFSSSTVKSSLGHTRFPLRPICPKRFRAVQSGQILLSVCSCPNSFWMTMPKLRTQLLLISKRYRGSARFVGNSMYMTETKRSWVR